MWKPPFLRREAPVLPNFMGIGAPRAGTTWLYGNLRKHPECFLPDRKELHFFDNKPHWKDLRSYSKFFEEGRDRVRGEVTPAYGHLPLEKIRYIRGKMPELRVVYLMRNPIERAWSSAVKGLCGGLVNTMQSFPKENRAFEDVGEDEFLERFQKDGTRARTDYLTVLRNWRSVYPEQQILIEFYDDLTENPEGLLRSVFSHIGVSSDIDLSDFPCREVFNANSPAPITDRCREYLFELYGDMIDELCMEFGDRVSRWRSK